MKIGTLSSSSVIATGLYTLALFSGWMLSTSLAFETHVQQRQLEVAVAPKFHFNLYYFVCGTEVYKCGSGSKVDPVYMCPKPPGTKPARGRITSAQCKALIEESRKPWKTSMLYKRNAKLCPNNARVVSYTKYTTEGAGRFCTNHKECICCHQGEVGGDPHLLTYDGTAYDYHGQCDLVMAQSSLFGNGIGLRVYARTAIIDDMWSLISNAAIQIGNETIEMTNDGTIYYNQMNVNDLELLPTTFYDKYNITKTIQMIGDNPKLNINVKLYDEGKQKIRLTLFKRLLSIHVGAVEHDLNGMLGHRLYDGMIGRDGTTILSKPNDLAQEWQVRDNEPMLFHSVRVPQYPERCLLPSSNMLEHQQQRRALRSEHHYDHHRRATEACSDITDIRKKLFCIDDIILTGDVDLAHLYHHNNHHDD